jgi:hypothetical protein
MTDEVWWLPKHRLIVAQHIQAAKLTKKERALGLWLLEACDDHGHVRASGRDLFLQISGAEPGPSGYVEVNNQTVYKVLARLCATEVIAFTWTPPFQEDVSVSFVKFPQWIWV